MAQRTLIIARMDEADKQAVADVFAESDATDLPVMLGASRRTLFFYRGLYLHLIEARDGLTERLYDAREHRLFGDVNTKLSRYVSPYDPDWKEPRDAMAEPFYTWVR
ncbi:TcmI family type II polyketide cyclase [Micromonospora sp. NPDC048170]|uniref:TcmI family type II polyketide cyclase n=1 Tax=Micromonospora sp. NPDC048170 TaxID=3154819 RepID=UPI0033D1024F